MPTILELNGFVIRIYPNDHFPAHVHVFKDGGETKINIFGEDNSPEWISVSKMSDKNAKQALKIVKIHQKELLIKWEEYHGDETKFFREKIRKSETKRAS